MTLLENIQRDASKELNFATETLMSTGKEMSFKQVEEIKRQFDLANITTSHLSGGEIL